MGPRRSPARTLSSLVMTTALNWAVIASLIEDRQRSTASILKPGSTMCSRVSSISGPTTTSMSSCLGLGQRYTERSHSLRRPQGVGRPLTLFPSFLMLGWSWYSCKAGWQRWHLIIFRFD